MPEILLGHSPLGGGVFVRGGAKEPKREKIDLDHPVGKVGRTEQDGSEEKLGGHDTFGRREDSKACRGERKGLGGG